MNRGYCQLRYPLFKNCPWLYGVMSPSVEHIKCFGAAGGKGGLLVSPVKDFRLKTYYELGNRFLLNGDENIIPDTTIDWEYNDGGSLSTQSSGDGADCVAGYGWAIDFDSSSPGTFLTTAKSCGDVVPNSSCKDINTGNLIKNPTSNNINGVSYVSSLYDYKYFQNSREVCTPIDPPITDEEGNIIKDEECKTEYFTDLGDSLVGDGLSPLYFDIYPTAKLTLSTSGCKRHNDIDLGTGTTAGKSGGIPFFVDDDGKKIAEGIKFCVEGVCNIYSTTNPDIISGSILATGGAGGHAEPKDLVDLATGLPLAPDNPASRCPDPEFFGVSGDTNMKFPAKYGTYHYCSGNMGIFTNKQYQFLTYSTSSSDYPCPAVNSNRKGDNNTLGLRIKHTAYRGYLHYGERGRAGQYRALFARSFGSSDIRMEPGKGGVANAISVGSSTPGASGEMTKLGADCIDENIDNCKSRFYSLGGVGGRSYLSEPYEYVPLTPKEIAEYVENPAKVPEPRYSINYTSTDDPDLYYIGEDSEFQQVSFLSDLSAMIDDADVLELIGKGGNGGYVKHNCWLMPQYFQYSTRASSSSSSYFEDVPNVDKDTIPVGLENETLDEWEGYTNFNTGIIGNIEACKANGKNYQNQFEETAGTNGYPGAIVIMW